MLPFQLPVSTSSPASSSATASVGQAQAHQLGCAMPQTDTFIFPQPGPVSRPTHSTEPTIPLGLGQMQLSALESTFADNPRPNLAVRQEIANRIGATARVVQLWFQERRKRAKDEKQLESTRVEMILAAAGSARLPAPKHASAVEFEQDDEPIVAPGRPTTPPQSRPSSASPIKAQADQQIAPPATPAKTPTRTTTALPVTPVQRITRDNVSPTKYASPSEASYASLERSLAVAEAAAKARNEAAAAAAAAAYAHTQYTVVTPGATGSYFYSRHPGQVHSPLYVAPGTPGFPSPQAPPIASPFIPMTPPPIGSHHPHGQYVISPIPLQRTYSTPGTITELQQQPQVFSTLAAPSLSDSKLAARRRRQGPPAVRLRRSHSYSATAPGEIPSAPAYMMTFPNPSAPASGAVSPVRSLSVSSPDVGSGLMRRSKSVSFVQSRVPSVRARKLTLGGSVGNGARHSAASSSSSNVSASVDLWTHEQADSSKPVSPVTPILSTAGSLMEVDDGEDADRSYKRARRRTEDLREDDDISTDEDEPDKRPDPAEPSWDTVDLSYDRQRHHLVDNATALPSSALSFSSGAPAATLFASCSVPFSEPPSVATADTTASMHAVAAELFMSSTDSTNTVSGFSDTELAALEQNQRLLMLTRQLDDLGIYGYGVLNDFT
ncbi:hypothetical protein POJ06DRAFT_55790 [Lipomyces tetrasporus]|uniref:Homeobox domain-containing protein n=1 Tax=Lipomyces tetrasporus TaxID=54092 RepID=A0AAD7VUT0_9ASCO|nr:uncharacterized protein POJ06DRAFT_55790 [Lipomyces tetrasporus]KAJ8102788.1 hypothetical protein POJ06DRAFT_55790 [Lipomyces tetrasporus]